MIYRRAISDLAVAERTLSGLLIPYEQRSAVILDRHGLYTETIARGAFDASLALPSWAFYFHNPASHLPLGRSGANMNLRASPEGIHFDLTLPETTLGNDLLELLRAGVLTGAVSAGYNAPASQVVWERSATPRHRRVLGGSIKELSIVPAGAFPQATSQLLDPEGKWRERKWQARKGMANADSQGTP
jgi:HK97 family phage prohead protease